VPTPIRQRARVDAQLPSDLSNRTIPAHHHLHCLIPKLRRKLPTPFRHFPSSIPDRTLLGPLSGRWEARQVPFQCPLGRARRCDGALFLGVLTCGDGSGCEDRGQRLVEVISCDLRWLHEPPLSCGNAVARTGPFGTPRSGQTLRIRCITQPTGDLSALARSMTSSLNVDLGM
jgi:hypothetical protein